MNGAGLAKLFPFDRHTLSDFADRQLFGRQISATTFVATRKAFAMIVRPGPTPSEVGQKTAIHREDAGIGIHAAIRVEDGMGRVVAKAEGTTLMGHVLIGRDDGETYSTPHRTS